MEQIYDSRSENLRMEPLPAAVVGTSLWLSSINMSKFVSRKYFQSRRGSGVFSGVAFENEEH